MNRFIQIGFHAGVLVNGTRMARILRIDADPALVLSAMIHARPRHPRSINPHIRLKTDRRACSIHQDE